MSLNPKTFEEALEKARSRPQKPRTPLRSRSRLKLAQKPILRKQKPLKKKVKRLSVGKLKRKVWIEFSIFIRTRDADAEGMVKCCTCDSVKHWKQMQAGHFIPGRLNNNLFDERGTNAQCSFCNVVRSGNGPKYYQFMRARYGEAIIDQLMQRNDETHKWQPGELDELLARYKALNTNNPMLKCESP